MLKEIFVGTDTYDEQPDDQTEDEADKKIDEQRDTIDIPDLESEESAE